MSELKRSLFSTVFRAIDSLTIEGVASSNSVDRMHDILEPGGMRKVGARGVPVLAQHNSEMPVARAVLWQSGNKIMSRITFPPEGTTEKSDDYRKLAKAGIIDTLSVGFIPHKWEPLKGGGLRYTDWECIELSLVSVPANPDAVVTARANNIEGPHAMVTGGFAKKAAAALNALMSRCGKAPVADSSGRLLSDAERRTWRLDQNRKRETAELLDSPRYRHLHRDKVEERLRYLRGRS